MTVFQLLEDLSDRRAADAVRARIDWKCALGLELTDRGFHFSVLTEFRARLLAGRAEHLLLDKMHELRAVSQLAWFERYGRRVEECSLPKGQRLSCSSSALPIAALRGEPTRQAGGQTPAA